MKPEHLLTNNWKIVKIQYIKVTGVINVITGGLDGEKVLQTNAVSVAAQQQNAMLIL